MPWDEVRPGLRQAMLWCGLNGSQPSSTPTFDVKYGRMATGVPREQTIKSRVESLPMTRWVLIEGIEWKLMARESVRSPERRERRNIYTLPVSEGLKRVKKHYICKWRAGQARPRSRRPTTVHRFLRRWFLFLQPLAFYISASLPLLATNRAERPRSGANGGTSRFVNKQSGLMPSTYPSPCCKLLAMLISDF